MKENTFTEIKVKAWVIRKAQEEARKYHHELNYVITDENRDADIATVTGVIEKITEKAICIECGDECEHRVWIPKSQIIA